MPLGTLDLLFNLDPRAAASPLLARARATVASRAPIVLAPAIMPVRLSFYTGAPGAARAVNLRQQNVTITVGVSAAPQIDPEGTALVPDSDWAESVSFGDYGYTGQLDLTGAAVLALFQSDEPNVAALLTVTLDDGTSTQVLTVPAVIPRPAGTAAAGGGGGNVIDFDGNG